MRVADNRKQTAATARMLEPRDAAVPIVASVDDNIHQSLLPRTWTYKLNA